MLGALIVTGCTTVTFPTPGRAVTPSTPLAAGVFAHLLGENLPPATPVTGEGQLTVRMSAPGTSWLSATNTSAVVEVGIDGGAVQTIVLFAGATPYSYTGFAGPLTTGAHDVVISVRDDLSVASGTPPVFVNAIDLAVIPNTDPGYQAIAHAPVLYGRGVSAHSDTPLFQYVDETTDIETTAIVNVDATGAVTSATYQTCAACPPDFPENQGGLDHSYATFAGTYFAGHPILRVATGNNVLKDAGTTAFRFQQGLIPGPLASETRESAMDPFPIGHRGMGEEMQREQAGYSTNPLSADAADARQYAIVDLDTTPAGTKAVGVELQIAGDTRWYANDLASAGSPVFYKGGHSRTVGQAPPRLARQGDHRGPCPSVPDDPGTGHTAVDHDPRVPGARDPQQLHDALPVGAGALGGRQPVTRSDAPVKRLGTRDRIPQTISSGIVPTRAAQNPDRGTRVNRTNLHYLPGGAASRYDNLWFDRSAFDDEAAAVQKTALGAWSRAAIAVFGLACLMAVVFASAARLPLLADDYAYLDVVQRPGWWHSSSTTWDVGGTPFRPVLHLWFGLLNQLFGLRPLPFHIASGFLVLVGGVMAGLVARRLGLRAGAYVATAFYCLHASMTTPIGWASAANSPLATALALGALYCMLRPHLRRVDVVASCALFLVALTTREVVAVVPAILVVTRYLVEPERPRLVRLKCSLCASLPLWFVLVAYAVVRRLAGFEAATGPYEQRLTSRGLTNLGRLMQIATDLEPFGNARAYSAFVAGFWIALVGLCALAALRSHRSQGLVGLTWALLGVLPVIFLTAHAMAYYYIDFALAGLAIAAGTAFEWIADSLTARIRIGFAAGCLAALVALSFYTARRQERAKLRLWAAATAVLVDQARRDNPHLTKGSTIAVGTDAEHLKAAVYLTAGGRLFRVIYDDPSLEVVYTDRSGHLLHTARPARAAPVQTSLRRRRGDSTPESRHADLHSHDAEVGDRPSSGAPPKVVELRYSPTPYLLQSSGLRSVYSPITCPFTASSSTRPRKLGGSSAL